jgi:hypothetical protein
MANEFDPYREALVLEESTIWPEEFDDVAPAERARIARLLHDSPQAAETLAYHRTHTGFCREITVTESDLARVRETVE